MRWITAVLPIFLLVSLGSDAAAENVCNAQGLGVQLEKFHIDRCDGALGYNDAIDCVNRLAEERDNAKERAETAISQAECLCNLLNKIIDGYGIYSRLKGACAVER